MNDISSVESSPAEPDKHGDVVRCHHICLAFRRSRKCRNHLYSMSFVWGRTAAYGQYSMPFLAHYE